MTRLLVLLLLLPLLPARAVDRDVQQLIVAIAPDWNSFTGKMQRFERKPGGSWRAVSPVAPVLFGKSGLAWGRGERGTEEPGRHKREGDRRAPAGVFALGTVYGYDAKLPAGGDYSYHQVQENDAWIDDPKLPQYNHHVKVDLRNPPEWFARQKMRHGDFAYHWLVEIEHNTNPAIPGEGSAIFFHIRRGEKRPSHGCTTMARPELERLIAWLRAAKRPHYALLPEDEYRKRWRDWDLPSPEVVAALD